MPMSSKTIMRMSSSFLSVRMSSWVVTAVDLAKHLTLHVVDLASDSSSCGLSVMANCCFFFSGSSSSFGVKPRFGFARRLHERSVASSDHPPVRRPVGRRSCF